MLIRFLAAVVTLSCCISLNAAEPEPALRTLEPGELENFQFEQQTDRNATEVVIEDLSIGQRYILGAQRQEARDLIAQELGVLAIQGDRSDLEILQHLYDRGVLRNDQVRAWQSMGILFGDILANEFNLQWVSYEDELGASKALRWRKTDNFVFPITAFSKRLQFGERLDMQAIYEKFRADIESFIDYERRVNS